MQRTTNDHSTQKPDDLTQLLSISIMESTTLFVRAGQLSITTVLRVVVDHLLLGKTSKDIFLYEKKIRLQSKKGC